LKPEQWGGQQDAPDPSTTGSAAGLQFAVVIPTRDRPELAKLAVERVLAQALPTDEIVVVVDGGDIDSPAVVLAPFDRLVLVHGAGEGPATARNLGAAATTASWIVFVDDDDIPDHDWLSELRTAATSHPSMAHVSVGHREQHSGTVEDAQHPQCGPAMSSITANYLAGTFALRRDIFEAVGGFTNGLRHMELTDLALRVFEHIADAHLSTAFDPQPRITMVVRPTLQRESQDPGLLVESAMTVIDRNQRLMERDPGYFANQLATVGVAAHRAGQSAVSRRLLWRAVRLRPSPTDLARALIASVPPLARKTWGPART
jgi:hypothetical protein